jgi:hypothetical protein
VVEDGDIRLRRDSNKGRSKNAVRSDQAIWGDIPGIPETIMR